MLIKMLLLSKRFTYNKNYPKFHFDPGYPPPVCG